MSNTPSKKTSYFHFLNRHHKHEEVIESIDNKNEIELKSMNNKIDKIDDSNPNSQKSSNKEESWTKVDKPNVINEEHTQTHNTNEHHNTSTKPFTLKKQESQKLLSNIFPSNIFNKHKNKINKSLTENYYSIQSNNYERENYIITAIVVLGLGGWILTIIPHLFQYYILRRFNVNILGITTIQLLLYVLVFSLLAHRLVAYVAGLAIRIILRNQMSYNGKYDIHIGWISYRGIFDRNEVVIHNIVWRNPSELFHRSPYILHVKEVSVSIRTADLIALIRDPYNAVIKVHQVLIDTVEVFIEKSDAKELDQPLNIFCAMQLDPLPDAATAARAAKSGQTKTPGASFNQRIGTFILSVVQVIKNKVSLTNLNRLVPVHMGRRDEEDDESGSDKKGIEGTSERSRADTNGSNSARSRTSSMFPSSLFTHKKTPPVTPTGQHTALAPLPASQSLPQSAHASHKDHSTPVHTPQPHSPSAASIPDKATPLIGDVHPATGSHTPTGSQQATVGQPPIVVVDQAGNAKKVEVQNPDFSDYSTRLIDIYRIQLFNIVIHPLDFLTDAHVDDSKHSDITIPSLYMSHKDLTKAPKVHGDPRRPIKIGQLINRLVEELATSLLAHNSTTIPLLLAHAAANQTFSALTKVGSLGVSTVSSVGSVGFTAVTTVGSGVGKMGSTVGSTVGSTFRAGTQVFSARKEVSETATATPITINHSEKEKHDVNSTVKL